MKCNRRPHTEDGERAPSRTMADEHHYYYWLFLAPSQGNSDGVVRVDVRPRGFAAVRLVP